MTGERVGAANAFAVCPDTRPEMRDALEAAVKDSGGHLVPLADARAMIWADPAAAGAFPEYISRAPNVEWVQLPWAGIEPFARHLDHAHVWTSGKDVYSRPVAEWIITALLSSFRHFHEFARATTWPAQVGRNLSGASLTVLGAGGITRSLLELLEPWDCRVTVVRRTSEPMAGAHFTTTADRLTEAVADADAVVVALALTDQTRGIINAQTFRAMRSDAWLINVARGGHVVVPDLLDALQADEIAGAVLDVTDPEPLPDGHPLWAHSNCIITPHVGNTPLMGLPLIAARVAANVSNWINGRPLVGVVDVDAGY